MVKELSFIDGKREMQAKGHGNGQADGRTEGQTINGPNSRMMIRPLTDKETSVLNFIESQIRENGNSPSYQEIKDHFGFASFNSVQNYLKQLMTKGYIEILPHQKRAIQILHSSKEFLDQTMKRLNKADHGLQSEFLESASDSTSDDRDKAKPSESISLPLLGKVAAGVPLEAYEYDESVCVPKSLVRDHKNNFALKVEGSSMIEEGILGGDIVLIQQQSSAKNGDIVVAAIESEATLKRFFLHQHPKNKGAKIVELRPANSSMKSIWCEPNEVEIKGVLVGLMRKF